MEHNHNHEFDYERMRKMQQMYLPDGVILEFVDPTSGDSILDLGSGSGYFSRLFASRSGVTKVVSVDASEKAHEILKKSLEEEGLTNVEPVKADLCSDFPAKGYNKVFISTVLHDIDCRDALMRKLSDGLPAGGFLIIVEFHKDSTIGPPGEIKIAQDDLIKFVESYGLVLKKNIDLEAHYIHRYEKSVK
ncbi:MAG: class I SAM-dependent methyltransferase [Candidatus Thermoplasmatota archaeon]|nr:class I SAM-dependent methyltransferase [Candidatus Thermoplasmatota archaeon]